MSKTLAGRIVCKNTRGFAIKPIKYLALGRLLFTALEIAFVITIGFESIFPEYCFFIPSAVLDASFSYAPPFAEFANLSAAIIPQSVFIPPGYLFQNQPLPYATHH